MLSFELKTVSFTFPSVSPHAALTLSIGFMGGLSLELSSTESCQANQTEPFIRNLFIRDSRKEVALCCSLFPTLGAKVGYFTGHLACLLWDGCDWGKMKGEGFPLGCDLDSL